MKECIQRFINDRNYAMSWTMMFVTIAAIFLSLFLIAKTVSEVKVWTASDDTYAANTISVEGSGEVVSVPDVATFSFGVDVTAESVETAQEEATRTMNLAIAYLEQNGVEEKDIKTSSYNVSPRYEYGFCQGINCPPQERQLVGYQVTQRVTVKVRETEKAGEILAGIGAQGVNNVSGLNFTIDDEDALREEARSLAVKDAREKAEKLADDLGVSLKKIVSFSEDSGYYPFESYAKGLGGVEDVAIMEAPRLPTGENTISTRVYITYEIK